MGEWYWGARQGLGTSERHKGAVVCSKPFASRTVHMSNPIHVLFLCTRNAARSVMAEACLNASGTGRFRGHSAGKHPTTNGQPDPMTIHVLEFAGIRTERLRSKGWNELAAGGATEFDLVVALSDPAEAEACPLVRDPASLVHWGYDDPAAVEGSEEEVLLAYRRALHSIRWRVELLASLPSEKIGHVLLAESARQLAGTSSSTT